MAGGSSIRFIAPSDTYSAITPSDNSDDNFTNQTIAIYVGSGGNIVAVNESGGTTTFVGAVTGSTIPIRCVRVNSTSTTASNLVGFFVE